MRFPLLTVGVLAAVASAPAVAADPPADLASNAALQYWKAFALMPSLSAEQEKLLKDWETVPLNEAVQKLVASSQASMTCLHRASKLTRCDWGLNYEDGVGMLLPHLTKARDMGRLAALHVRYEFDRGNTSAGRDDAQALMSMARHVGRDPVMIAVLVRFGIEGFAVDALAPYVPEFGASADQARMLYARLPAAPSVRDTIKPEKELFLTWMIRKLKDEEGRKKGAGLVLWKNFLSGSEVPDSLKQVATADEAIELTENLLPVYDDLAKLTALPKAEFETKYPSFKQKTKDANPAAGVILPAVDKLLAKEQRNEARFAMLLAAIAVAEGGPDKLKDIPDPFGNGPFEYRPLDRGFELKSKLTFEEKPVTLIVGQRKK